MSTLPTGIPPSAPSRFSLSYNDPNTLVTVGPLLKATWSVPPVLATRLAAAGRPVPPPIHGYLLIDTGASSTCMSRDAAGELGLTAVGLRPTFGASGLHDAEIFEAYLTIVISDSLGNTTTIESFRQAAGIPDLEKAFERLGLITADSHPRRLIGLLGREFLRHATMTYHGSKGIVEVTMDMRSLASAKQTTAPPPSP